MHLGGGRRGAADELAGRRGRAVQVDSIKTRVESAPGVCNQRLKLKCDEPLSHVAFNFNLRRYNSEGGAIYAVGSVLIEDTTFAFNKATMNGGRGLLRSFQGVKLRSTLFEFEESSE